MQLSLLFIILFFFFFNDTATTEIYTLSLHDALPIFASAAHFTITFGDGTLKQCIVRSEEHTSELQSRFDLVCRLLLEKKKQDKHTSHLITKKKNQKKTLIINNTQ